MNKYLLVGLFFVFILAILQVEDPPPSPSFIDSTHYNHYESECGDD